MIVATEADLRRVLDQGERAVQLQLARSGEFPLLRTLGLESATVDSTHILDLIEVVAAGAAPYVVANMVLAGTWAGDWRVVRRRPIELVMGERVLHVRASALAVANGQFARGGRWIAPRAHPADGRLAVVVEGRAFFPARAAARRVVRGDHLPHPLAWQLRPETVAISGPPWRLCADGEQGRGTLPATFGILPGALTLHVFTRGEVN